MIFDEEADIVISYRYFDDPPRCPGSFTACCPLLLLFPNTPTAAASHVSGLSNRREKAEGLFATYVVVGGGGRSSIV